MARKNVIDVGIGIQLDGMARDLARMSGMTEREARKMVSGLDRQVKRAESASKKAARETQRAWERSMASLPGGSAINTALTTPMLAAGAAATALGAAMWSAMSGLSDAVDQANLMSASTGLTTKTVGALEYALGGAGVTVDQFRTSLTQFNQKLTDNEGALNDLGVATRNAGGDLRSTDDILVSTFDALAGIEDGGARAAASADLFGARGAALAGVMQGVNADLEYGRELAATWYGPDAQQASADMDRAMRDLKVTLRGVNDEVAKTLIPTFRKFSIGVVYPWTYASEAMDEFTTRAAYNLSALNALRKGDIAGLMAIKDAYFADVGEGGFFENVSAAADEAMAKILGVQTELAEAEGAASGGRRRTKDSSGAATVNKDLQALLALTAKTADANRAAWLSSLGPLEEIDARYQGIREQVIALGIASGDLAAVDAAWQEVDAGYQREREAALTAQLALTQELAAAEQERQAAMDAEQMAALLEGMGAARSAAVGLIGDFGALGDAIAQSAEQGSAAQRAAAQVGFRATQASALAGTAMRTHEAIMAAQTVPPPAGQILAGIALASGIAQGAAIAAQSPPAFHVGGAIMGGSTAPDEVYRATRSEAQVGVVTRRGLNALNRGESGGPTVQVQQVYQHRAYGDFVADNLRLPHSPLRKAIRAGRKVGHRG